LGESCVNVFFHNKISAATASTSFENLFVLQRYSDAPFDGHCRSILQSGICYRSQLGVMGFCGRDKQLNRLAIAQSFELSHIIAAYMVPRLVKYA
jgi:hypothetical protein